MGYVPSSFFLSFFDPGGKLPDVPFRLFAACAKDGYRKPMPGMWYELERIFKEQHVDIGVWGVYDLDVCRT